MASLFAVMMVGLMVLWFVAPIIGIIRASMRKARGDSSTLAPIFAGSCLALLVLIWLSVFLVKKESRSSPFAYIELVLHIGWLYYAIHANRAAARRSAKLAS